MATKIILQCIDKTLEPLSLPKLTSGGKKDIVLELQFDESWSGYGGRVATFWRDKNLVHHAALVSDACEVPWSDVFEPGVLTVAVFGVNGGVVKTSEAIDLVIEQGAITGQSSMEPIPDVYQQLLNAYGKVSAAQAVESARLDQALAGSTANGSEAADIRVSAEGLTYAAAGEAVRNQIARVRSEAAHASIYDLDAVKDHLGLTRVNGIDAVVGQITDATKTWQYAYKDIALQPGLYTVVVRDLHIPAGGYFAIAVSTTGQKYLKITEPGIYTMKVYDDGQSYNPEAVPMLLQMAQDVGMPVGVYYAAGISIYAGDITILPAIPESLTGADKKLDKQVGKNLFDKNSPDIVMERFLSGGGVPTVNEYSGGFYCTGFIPIEAETTYALTDYKIGGACIVFYDERKSFISGLDGGNNLVPAGGIFVTPAGAAYVRLTGNIANIGTNQLEKGGKITAFEPYTEYAPAGDNKRRLNILDKRLNAPAVEMVERSTLAAGESMAIASPHAKNHNVINFSAKVQSFSGLVVSHGKTEPFCSAYAVIGATHVHVYGYRNAETLLATYAHGLTISGFLRVSIHVMGDSSAKLTLTTAGGSYVQNIEWNGSKGDILVESQGSTLTDCVLTYYMEGLRRNVWLFGDSYFDYWPEVLAGMGYTNYYLDSYSGRGSAAALESLQKCLAYAVPGKLVWCMGMNDNDSSWKVALESVKTLCEQYDVELILATVPNVPERNHAAKNEIVRTSGLRYVDFCEAVGADKSTSWTAGLQSGDGVHPSARGAVALASRALVDVPELAELGAGVGIVSIEQTAGTGAPGTDVVYTITMSDGSTLDFKVHQGADGAGAGGSGDMTKAVYDTDNDGVIDKAKTAETADKATTAETANSAANADHASTADNAVNAGKFGGQLPEHYAAADHSHTADQVAGAFAAADYDGLIVKKGNPVTETLKAGRGITAVATLALKQAGSGDPSPDNIRPITGWDKLELSHAGKNLIPYCDFSSGYTNNGITATINADKSITFTGTATADAYFYLSRYTTTADTGYDLPSGEYILSGCPAGGASGVYGLTASVYKDGVWYSGASDFGSGERLTVPAACRVNMYIRFGAGVNANGMTFYPMIRPASIDDATYEAPGKVYTVQIGQTVCGGKFDWLTGKLVLTHKYVEYGGDAVFYSPNTGLVRNGEVIRVTPLLDPVGASKEGEQEVFCNLSTNNLGGWANAPIVPNVYILDEYPDTMVLLLPTSIYGTTEASVKAKLAETPLQVVYKLATPVEIPFTGAGVIEALEGVNTIYGDGDLEVTMNHDRLLTLMWPKLMATAAETKTE